MLHVNIEFYSDVSKIFTHVIKQANIFWHLIIQFKLTESNPNKKVAYSKNKL